MRAFFLSLACLALAGCMDNSLPKYSKLESLRVVAMVADTPDVAAGSTPTITPWIADPLGGTRALRARAVGCVDPGVSLGADPTCDGNPTFRELVAETALAWPDANDSTDRAGAAQPTVSLSAGDTASILTGRTAADRFNGVAYLVIYQVWAADGSARVNALKRILVSDKSAIAGQTRNANPALTDILGNGASFAAFPAAAVNLLAQIGAGSAEAYKALKADGGAVDRTEEIVTSWFITDGELKYFRTVGSDVTLYTPPSARPSGRNAVIMAVARDGRGGEVAAKRRLL